jgi:hypothetical protein
MLSRESILESEKIVKAEKVFTPEWAEPGMPIEEAFVWVRALSAAERDAWEASLIERKKADRRRGLKAETKLNLDNVRAKLAAATTVDAEVDGNPLFLEQDIEALGALPGGAAPLDRIYATAQRLSGISDNDIEDLAKNSETTPSAASRSAAR